MSTTQSHSEPRYIARSFGRVVTGQHVTPEGRDAEVEALGLRFAERLTISVWVLGDDDIVRQAAVAAQAEASREFVNRERANRRDAERAVEASFGF